MGPPRWAEPQPGGLSASGLSESSDLFSSSINLPRGPMDLSGCVDVCAGPARSGAGASELPQARSVRHRYELRTLQALGVAAPPVRMCHGGLAEAARLVGDCLRSEAAVDSDAARSE